MLTLIQQGAPDAHDPCRRRAGEGAEAGARCDERVLLLAAVFTLTAGCSANVDSTEPSLDGGAGAGPTAGDTDAGYNRRLRLSTSELAVEATKMASFEARLEDERGDPVPGEVVSFTLSGAAQDSGLEALSVVTDADGLAENAVRAGTLATTFTVRVAADGALPVSMDVTTTRQGLWPLRIGAAYTGARTPDTRVISVFAGLACDQLENAMETPPAAQTMVLSDESESEAYFELQPATRYTLRALARGAGGTTVVASDCIEDVTVTPNKVTRHQVDWRDRPLVVQGDFAARALLDAEEPARHITTTMAQAMTDRVTTAPPAAAPSAEAPPAEADGAGDTYAASYLIDALQRAMRSEDYALTELANLVVGTALPDLESTLQQALEDADVGPEAAIEVLRQDTLASLAAPELTLRLTFQEMDEDDGREDRLLIVRPQALQGKPTDSTRQAPTVTFDASAAVDVTGTYVSQADALSLDLTIALPLMLLADQTLRQVAARRTGEGDLAIAEQLGCDALASWWAEAEMDMGPGCGSDCIQTACERALADLLTAGSGVLLGVPPGESLSAEDAALSSTLTLIDEDGDLLPDAIRSERLAGTWSGTEFDGEVSGVLTGTVASPM